VAGQNPAGSGDDGSPIDGALLRRGFAAELAGDDFAGTGIGDFGCSADLHGFANEWAASHRFIRPAAQAPRLFCLGRKQPFEPMAANPSTPDAS
jgi:hypothetical protein